MSRACSCHVVAQLGSEEAPCSSQTSRGPARGEGATAAWVSLGKGRPVKGAGEAQRVRQSCCEACPQAPCTASLALVPRASARQGGGSPFRRLLSGPVTSCLSASAQHAHPHPARGRPSPYYCRHGYLSSPSYFVRASLSWESEELSMVLAAVMGQEWSRDPTTQSR